MISIKTEEDIALLREGGAHLAAILSTLKQKVHPGLRTQDLENEAQRLIAEYGDTPSFFNYQPEGAKQPYPAALCVSINEEVVHGIPSERLINEGDVVGLDLGLIHHGVYVDAALTVGVPPLVDPLHRLIAVTKEALSAGIRVVREGHTVGDIGAAVASIAEEEGFYVIRDLSGHGVGYAVHEDPIIPNWGKAGRGETLCAGMVIAIEPMLSIKDTSVRIGRDGFAFVTKKGSISAHFEHTVVVTKEGSEILTAYKEV